MRNSKNLVAVLSAVILMIGLLITGMASANAAETVYPTPRFIVVAD